MVQNTCTKDAIDGFLKANGSSGAGSKVKFFDENHNGIA